MASFSSLSADAIISSEFSEPMPGTLRMRLIVSSFNQRLATVPVTVTTPPLTATTGRRDP